MGQKAANRFLPKLGIIHLCHDDRFADAARHLLQHIERRAGMQQNARQKADIVIAHIGLNIIGVGFNHPNR